MTNSAVTLHLNAFLTGVGHHEAAWRHPRTDPRRVTDVKHFVELARIAERGTLEPVFFADTLHVGLIATASTSCHEPFNLARVFASLDHPSGGRAGWNLVTSASDAEARNFNLSGSATHSRRYERAADFVDVTLKPWDSWEPDALVLDPASGVFADTDRVHPADHVGPHFCVAGALNVPRSPQGRPVPA